MFCRNVLIYFDHETKTRTLQAIARLMSPDGALYLGGAETILGIDCALVPYAGSPGIFRKQVATAGLIPAR